MTVYSLKAVCPERYRIEEILKPKSVYVERFNAHVGDEFEIMISMGSTRRHATSVGLTNLNDPNLNTIWIPQEQFFGSFQQIWTLKEIKD